jgi:hypothetical protein
MINANFGGSVRFTGSSLAAVRTVGNNDEGKVVYGPILPPSYVSVELTIDILLPILIIEESYPYPTIHTDSHCQFFRI